MKILLKAEKNRFKEVENICLLCSYTQEFVHTHEFCSELLKGAGAVQASTKGHYVSNIRSGV
uniref:Uncharacterized protein n=1 Tax=Anguilla anguilla TaxID=7936 RepID=A0A0E9R678_ANGAN